MNAYHVKIAASWNISPQGWQELVTYLNNDPDLALAARMFYVVNKNSTHSFDYYVPDKMTVCENQLGMDEVRDYLLRARIFIALLMVKTVSDLDHYYLAAKLVGVLS